MNVSRCEFEVNWRPGHVAAYLFEWDELILVDAGCSGQKGQKTLERAVTSRGYELNDIQHLVITHPHVDHTGQVQALINEADATVYAPVSVRDRFNRPLTLVEEAVRQNAVRAGVPDESVEDVISRNIERQRTFRKLLPTESVNVWYDRDDSISIGGLRFETVFTPGHQADHCCFLVMVDGERNFFSGDMAILTFRAIAAHSDMDEGVEDSISAYYTSLSKLKNVEAHTIYPAHGPVHTDISGAIDQSFESLETAMATTRRLVEDGNNTAVEVNASRFSSPLEHLPETIGALSLLVQRGKLIRETDQRGTLRYELA